MQMAVPEVMSLADEPAYLQRSYGMEAEYEPTRIYAAQCIIARRMLEQGVRFIELTCPRVGGDRWDQHSNLYTQLERQCIDTDAPSAALVMDLKERGLFSDTLILWAGEMGRTPHAGGAPGDGRDHHTAGFSVWLAGGGVKGGVIHGATDEFGMEAVENVVAIFDLHATILHLLGLDHQRLTFRYGGRDMRLTDVHGHVVKEILT